MQCILETKERGVVIVTLQLENGTVDFAPVYIYLELHNDYNNVGQVCNPHEHPIAGWYMLRFIRGRLVFKVPTHLH